MITRTKTRTPVHRVPQTLFSKAFLGDESPRRRYRAQPRASDGSRPLASSKIGPNSGSGEDRQGNSLDWQMWATVEHWLAPRTCIRSWTDECWVGGRGAEGWYFRLARKDRRSRSAPRVAENPYRWEGRELREYRWEVSVVLYRCAAMAGFFLLLPPGVRSKKTAKEGTYLRQRDGTQIMAFACFVCFGRPSRLPASPNADTVTYIRKPRRMGAELDSDGDPWSASGFEGISTTRPNDGPNGRGGRA